VPILPETENPYTQLLKECQKNGATLLAVSKTRKEKQIMELYTQGQRVFGENRAHELIIKASLLPTDIEWHLIGHLQTNKVKSVISFASCIQSLDSWKLWQKIQAEAEEAEKNVLCFLQIKIASEETKYGWDYAELMATLQTGKFRELTNVSIGGVMGMATLTEDQEQVRREFRQLREYFETLKSQYFKDDPGFRIISMGMSGDYKIALEEGSNMIRVGSMLFS
jgi:hypothetical protein